MHPFGGVVHFDTANRTSLHPFGGAVNARAPLLAEQKEYCGDEHSGMADADPEDKVDDGEAPAYGILHAPDAYSHAKQICEQHEEEHGEH